MIKYKGVQSDIRSTYKNNKVVLGLFSMFIVFSVCML
jgi:hypothetical protein